MLTWALWTTQQYQHHNITNIHQATWNPQQNHSQYLKYSAYTSNNSANAFNKPVNNFNYSVSVPNYHKTQQYQSTVKPITHFYSTSNEQGQKNITMELEKFYNFRYDTYSVHFPNRTAIPIDEIRDIFCRFGEISSCKQTGGDTGLVFVNYKTKDAAIKCVKGLKDHPSIKLRPIKLYNASKNNNNNDNSHIPKSYDYPRSEKYDYPLSTSSSGLNNSLDIDKYNDQRRESNNNSNHGSERSYTVEENKPKKISDQLSVNIEEKSSTQTINNGDNAEGPKFTAADNVLNRMEELSLDEHDSVPMDLPKLIPAKKKVNSERQAVKDAIKTTIDVAKKPVEVIEAQEIIVANIEDNYGVPAILHLLEKYEPICASPIKICKPYSVRYCHVFFTNIHHAEAAECEFDDYEWSPSKKLMVLRVNTLAVLASTA